MKLLKPCHNTLILFLFTALCGYGQELNCSVQINTSALSQPNRQVFRTLETALSEFINNNSWTDERYEDYEKIDCSLVIVVQNYSNDLFSGNLQVAASRPVYNSTYSTPILNFKDSQITFQYTEFQPLFYNENSFQDNLTSLITYYIYTILGLDADTYELRGGEKYHKEAQRIVSLAQSSNRAGWTANDGRTTRYRYNTDLLNNTFEVYREILYEYHRDGLDKMYQGAEEAKKIISSTLFKLKDLNSRRPNNFLSRTFFDTKADEITSIFASGPTVDIKELKSMLLRIAPNHSGKWRNIKY